MSVKKQQDDTSFQKIRDNIDVKKQIEIENKKHEIKIDPDCELYCDFIEENKSNLKIIFDGQSGGADYGMDWKLLYDSCEKIYVFLMKVRSDLNILKGYMDFMYDKNDSSFQNDIHIYSPGVYMHTENKGFKIVQFDLTSVIKRENLLNIIRIFDSDEDIYFVVPPLLKWKSIK